MKKIVRLTESDLVRLVKRVINEGVIGGPTTKNGNIVIDGQVWELWTGWIKVEVLYLKPLNTGDFEMKWDTSLTEPGIAIVTNQKYQELLKEKDKGKVKIEFEVEMKDKDGKKTKRTLQLIKK